MVHLAIEKFYLVGDCRLAEAPVLRMPRSRRRGFAEVECMHPLRLLELQL